MIVGPDRMVWAAGAAYVHLPQFDIKPSLDRIDPFTRKLRHSYPLPPAAAIIAMTSHPSLNSVWFADAGRNAIGGIVATTGFIQIFKVPTPNAGLAGISLGHDGNVWFTESKANKIGRFNPAGAGTFTEYPVPAANAGLGQIVEYSARRFYFVETHALGRITYLCCQESDATSMRVDGGHRYCAKMSIPPTSLLMESTVAPVFGSIASIVDGNTVPLGWILR